MTTMTIAARRLADASGQVLVLLLLTLMTTVTVVAPSHAQPHGPNDFAQPQAEPRLEVEPDCDPAGFHWEMVHPDAPPHAVYQGQWREAPDGPIQNLPFNEASGFQAAPNGDYQVRGGILVQGVVFHEYDWVDVTVSCIGGFVPVPRPDPSVTISVEPVCDVVEGFAWVIEVTSPPEGPTAHELQWRPEDGGPVSKQQGTQGVAPSGEGTFEARGVLYDQNPGFHASDWVLVTVDCSEPADNGGGGDVDPDAPRPGTPTFTG